MCRPQREKGDSVIFYTKFSICFVFVCFVVLHGPIKKICFYHNLLFKGERFCCGFLMLIYDDLFCF